MKGTLIIICVIAVLIIVISVLGAALHSSRAKCGDLARTVKIYEEQLDLQRQRVDEAIKIFRAVETQNAERKAHVKVIEKSNPEWSSACVPADVASVCNDLCNAGRSTD